MSQTKVDKKVWAIIGIGGVAALASAILVSQWKHVQVGKQVTTNVLRFLIDHGSVINNGVVSGGVIQTPMKVNTVVNSTVVQLLNRISDELEEQGDSVDRPPVPNTKPGKKRPKARPQTALVSGDKQQSIKTKQPTGGLPMTITDKIRDDAGYKAMGGHGSSSQKEQVSEYNPDDVIPTSKSRPPDSAVFSDDDYE